MSKYKIISYDSSFFRIIKYKIKVKYKMFPFYITIKKELDTLEIAEKYLEQLKKEY